MASATARRPGRATAVVVSARKALEEEFEGEGEVVAEAGAEMTAMSCATRGASSPWLAVPQREAAA
jgi:hypothetical protein